uniref:cDNA FLJ90064 fis, clone HEMBA1003487 n=1 Tax=Homo sapiens TaxID=9606 RepID=Q8N2Q0_HUMAN|nr:unnamed protein product [Homo sapiens]
MRPRMLPVFFGESIKVNPEPTHEIRCNSEVKYASEKHFQDKVFYAPVPTVTAYSETIVAAPNCTWRNYRSRWFTASVQLQLCQEAGREAARPRTRVEGGGSPLPALTYRLGGGLLVLVSRTQ